MNPLHYWWAFVKLGNLTPDPLVVGAQLWSCYAMKSPLIEVLPINNSDLPWGTVKLPEGNGALVISMIVQYIPICIASPFLHTIN